MTFSLCFTINNYTPVGVGKLKALLDTANCVYLVIGYEVANTGTKHIQGFVQFKRKPPKGALGFNKMLNFKKGGEYANCEEMRGTPHEASGYCKKGTEASRNGQSPGNEYFYFNPSSTWRGFELGEIVVDAQGARCDLKDLCSRIMNGDMSIRQMRNNPEYASYIHQYGRTLTSYQEAYDKKQGQAWCKPEVRVLCGKAGEGKSSYVYKKHGYDNVFTLDSEASQSFLLDGYDGEPVLLIDDFKGWIKYTTMLRLLDGHPMKLNIKGGRTYKAWKHVYITSNVAPALWWQKGIGENMARRFYNGVHVIENSEIIQTFEKDEVFTNNTHWDCYDD